MSTPAWSARILLPAADVINANDREHWRKRAHRAKAIRDVAKKTAVVTRVPHLTRARIDVVIDFPDRRRRDTHNLMPTVKPIVDGLVDAGLLPDDDTRHLTGPHLHPGEHLSPERVGQRTFTFTITATDLEEDA